MRYHINTRLSLFISLFFCQGEGEPGNEARELALETRAKGSSLNCSRVHDLNHTHSLASFQWSVLSDLHLTENCLQCLKWSPYTKAEEGTKAEGFFLIYEGELWPSKCRPKHFYSYPRQPQYTQHFVTMLAHLPLSHPFF